MHLLTVSTLGSIHQNPKIYVMRNLASRSAPVSDICTRVRDVASN